MAASSAPAPASAPAEVDNPSAAQLDSRRLAAGQTATVTQQQPAPAVVQPVVEAPAPAPVVPTVQEGDVIEFTELDTPPAPVNQIRAEYPRLAMQQKAQGTVVVSALISERGEVIEVKILKGDPRFGFNEAAMRAMRAARFSAPMKSGKHVRTWRPQMFVFNPV
jgi:TonB family protein